MLEIERVSWRNFLSYGDYTTTVELSKLGQCLITGEITDVGERETYGEAGGSTIKRSNGSGKSNCTAVIQWILFGRTSHSDHDSGDNVINWFTKKDCWGRIDFKNGDSITRTRNCGGTNELIYIREGTETKYNCDTLATTKLQQGQLNKIFGLDWEIFCGATFFSQYNKPWMEMTDQARKKAIERLLHVDRFTFYADVAKKKAEKLGLLVERSNGKKDNLENEILRLESEISRIKSASAQYDAQRQIRYQAVLAKADLENTARNNIIQPDIIKLQAKWDLVKKVQDKITEQQQQSNKLQTEADSFNDKINRLNADISKHSAAAAATTQTIKLWKERGGKICKECEQSVPHDHIAGKIEPLSALVDAKNQAADELRNQQNALRDQQQTIKIKHKELLGTIQQTQLLLAQKKPSMTVMDAQSIINRWNQHDNEEKRLRMQAEAILTEQNPHNESADSAQARIEQCRAEIVAIVAESKRHELLNRHYHYIHKVYHDRTKIKSLIFRDHIPFINARLKYYLDAFGLDIRLELTDSLSVVSNLWNYKYESGGERKRTDVAFMLAIFDFHEHMFGRQCNILVMDEVDGRLDDDGIDALINIIKNDLANRVETLLIISHRGLMHDTFPREIKIIRTNRFSRLEVV